MLLLLRASARAPDGRTHTPHTHHTQEDAEAEVADLLLAFARAPKDAVSEGGRGGKSVIRWGEDRKSTRLNSSHTR